MDEKQTETIIRTIVDLVSPKAGGKETPETPAESPDSFEDTIRSLVEAIRPVKGRDYQDGRDGTDANEQRIVDEVMRRIQVPKDGLTPVKGKDYRDGRDGRDGKQGPPGERGKDGSNAEITAGQIAERLNTKKGIVDWSVLKNVPKNLFSTKKRLGRGTGSPIQYYDLTSQCNGVLKTFTIPLNDRVLGVFGTQFPVTYRPEVDWTGSGTTSLVLTSEVSAPETSQTLYILYVAST